MRFINRKHCEVLLSKSKLFKSNSVFTKAGFNHPIYINSNLCGYYRFLWGHVKSLFLKKLIKKFRVYNGTINILLSDETYSRKITHLNDLVNIFPNESF